MDQILDPQRSQEASIALVMEEKNRYDRNPDLVELFEFDKRNNKYFRAEKALAMAPELRAAIVADPALAQVAAPDGETEAARALRVAENQRRAPILKAALDDHDAKVKRAVATLDELKKQVEQKRTQFLTQATKWKREGAPNQIQWFVAALLHGSVVGQHLAFIDVLDNHPDTVRRWNWGVHTERNLGCGDIENDERTRDVLMSHDCPILFPYATPLGHVNYGNVTAVWKERSGARAGGGPKKMRSLNSLSVQNTDREGGANLVQENGGLYDTATLEQQVILLGQQTAYLNEQILLMQQQIVPLINQTIGEYFMQAPSSQQQIQQQQQQQQQPLALDAHGRLPQAFYEKMLTVVRAEIRKALGANAPTSRNRRGGGAEDESALVVRNPFQVGQLQPGVAAIDAQIAQLQQQRRLAGNSMPTSLSAWGVRQL